jgi:hypothetical protein
MEIQKTQTTYSFYEDNGVTVVPLDSVLFTTSETKNTINVRLKGSRRNVVAFDYTKVTNITASSAADFVNKLIQL